MGLESELLRLLREALALGRRRLEIRHAPLLLLEVLLRLGGGGVRGLHLGRFLPELEFQSLHLLLERRIILQGLFGDPCLIGLAQRRDSERQQRGLWDRRGWGAGVGVGVAGAPRGPHSL